MINQPKFNLEDTLRELKEGLSALDCIALALLEDAVGNDPMAGRALFFVHTRLADIHAALDANLLPTGPQNTAAA